MKAVKYYISALLLCCCVFAQAHVNSPGVNYQGKAGNYTVLVNIAPPDVIPGIADVSVYVENYKGEKVYVQTGYYQAGSTGSAPAETATVVAGAAGWFDNAAWLTRDGTAYITIIIEGAKGKGTVTIPVMAVPTARHGMTKQLGITLGFLGLLLFAIMVTIISASVSDGLLKPGETQPNLWRKRIKGITVALVLLLIILYGAYRWCRTERLDYMAYLYKPIAGHSEVITLGGKMALHLSVDNNILQFGHEPLSLVVPDHGKLMHLVPAKVKTLDVFAHLHPLRTDSLNYMVNLPTLPAGKYLLYGDVVSWNGFSETITDTVNIPANDALATIVQGKEIATSPDDSWLISSTVDSSRASMVNSVAICGNPGVNFKLADGSNVVFEHPANTPFKVKKFCALTFHVFDPAGKPAALQPYMGMTGHAIVIKYDGLVYSHLHPVGNFAMAAQEQVATRMKSTSDHPAILPADHKRFQDSIDRVIAKIDNMTEAQRNNYLNAEMGMGKGMDMKGMEMPAMANAKTGTVVQFPYSFPVPGRYRIWVQVKINGKVQTANFDTMVN